MSIIAVATEKDFTREVLTHQGLVLVDFWAAWCGPCISLHAELERLAEKVSPACKIVTVDAEAAKELALSQDVHGYPTLVFYNGGEEIERMMGFYQAATLRAKINRLQKSL